MKTDIPTDQFQFYFFRAVLFIILLLISLHIVNGSTIAHAQNSTEVGGPIFTNTTWTAANSPYIVIESIDVWEDVTLTIDPGVVVKFSSGKTFQVNGELIAQGTENNPITFTSNQADPAPGDWGGIEFTDTAITTSMDSEGNYLSGSILQYCVVEYAGNNTESALDTHSLLVDNCSVQNNDTRGISSIGNENFPGRITNSYITNNKIDNCGFNPGGGIYALESVVENNVVTENSCTETSTYSNAIAYGGGIYAEDSILKSNTVIRNVVSALEELDVYRNDAKAIGGGIYAVSSTIDNNLISDNTAFAQADGYYGSESNGGGIWANNSIVKNNTIAMNSVSIEISDGNASGGGLYAVSNSIVDNNLIKGNTADYAGGGLYVIDGDLSKNTIINNSAYKGGGVYVENSTVSDNEIIGNSASGNGGGLYAHTTLSREINENLIIDNNAENGGGVYVVVEPSISHDEDNFLQMNWNKILNNLAKNKGGGIYAYSKTNSYLDARNQIKDCLIFDNVALKAGGVYAEADAIFGNASIIFIGDNFINNRANDVMSGGLVIGHHNVTGYSGESNLEIHQSNIYSNEPYDIVVTYPNDIDGTQNYWGTTDSIDILNHIYDWYDHIERGKFIFAPFLQKPSDDAAFPPPTYLLSEFQNNAIEFTWDKPPYFTTGYGFKLYYDLDSSLPPFEGTDLIEGNSPIEVGTNNSFIIEGFSPNENYYFAVTAHDNLGNESWYSNVISITTPSGCTFSGTIDLQGRSDDSGATFTAGANSTTTDSAGNYELIVPAGTYDVTAEMDRYLDSERIGENCPAGETIQLPNVALLGGDANDDCVINILDLAFMGARFNLSTGDGNFDTKADINADGVVNIQDLSVAGGNFHGACPVGWP